MWPRLTVTRRVALMFLLGLVASVLAVVLFATVYWRGEDESKPARDSNVFALSAMLVEARGDPALTARLLDLAKRDLPDDALSVYTADGVLVATTTTPAFPPLPVGTALADGLGLDTRDTQALEIVPIDAASGARFYALRRLPEKPAPAGVALWLWISAALPVVCCLVVALVLGRSITRPLDRILRTSRALAEGDLSARVGLSRRDELGALASTLDDMAERIASLLRARTELLALVSHELRTPLSRIRVALDLAAEGDVERARRALSSIGLDLAELERLLGDTLTYTRLELVERGGEETPLALEEFDSTPFVHEAAERFRHAFPERALHVETDADLPLLVADRVLLMRVVLNLLDNAAKYGPAEPGVRLRATHGAGRLTLEVTDAGEALDPADVARLFEPFFRARSTQRGATTDGLGLGLTLCRRVVEAHGGKITAESASGRGTTLRVTLPL
jgi:signal transduction histidine kinase